MVSGKIIVFLDATHGFAGSFVLKFLVCLLLLVGALTGGCHKLLAALVVWYKNQLFERLISRLAEHRPRRSLIWVGFWWGVGGGLVSE